MHQMSTLFKLATVSVVLLIIALAACTPAATPTPTTIPPTIIPTNVAEPTNTPIRTNTPKPTQTSGGSSSGQTSHSITYRVTGVTENGVSVMYYNETGDVEQATVSIPWTKTFSAQSGAVLSIAVINESGSGSVKCEIMVDGLTVHQATSPGANAIAMCSWRLTPTSGGSASGQTSHSVAYRVTGVTENGVSVKYANETGDIEQATVSIPWTKTFSVQSGADLYIAVQNESNSGSVKCEIMVDGLTVHQATSSGANAIAMCSGRS